MAAALLLVTSQLALAQQEPAPDALPQPPAPPAQPAPPIPAPSGVFDSIGRFFQQGAADFRAHVEGAKQRIDDLNGKAAATGKTFGDKAAEAGQNAANVTKGAVDATRTAVEAVATLPTQRVVNGRERCELAANGAPDCQAAAEQLCRKKGFATGKSMDFTSAEQCPPRVYLSGRQPGDCTMVTFISRAMCQ